MIAPTIVIVRMMPTTISTKPRIKPNSAPKILTGCKIKRCSISITKTTPKKPNNNNPDQKSSKDGGLSQKKSEAAI